MIFHVSNLTPECYAHPLTRINLTQTMGRFDMWVTLKTNRPSFCLILKLSHPLDGVFSVLHRLHGRKQMHFLLSEGSLNETTFIYCCLGFFLAWHLTHCLFSVQIAIKRRPLLMVLVNTYFLNFRLVLLTVLRNLVHLIYLIVFINFLVFNFS